LGPDELHKLPCKSSAKVSAKVKPRGVKGGVRVRGGRVGGKGEVRARNGQCKFNEGVALATDVASELGYIYVMRA